MENSTENATTPNYIQIKYKQIQLKSMFFSYFLSHFALNLVILTGLLCSQSKHYVLPISVKKTPLHCNFTSQFYSTIGMCLFLLDFKYSSYMNSTAKKLLSASNWWWKLWCEKKIDRKIYDTIWRICQSFH